jgi:23S rRNA pseudouridine1911/1915/1917 synthase
VLSHPNSVWDVRSPSVAGFLYHKYKDLPSIGNFIRAWLVHRLDKWTDWLMIIVKTEKWLEYFKKLFQDKSEKTTIEEKEATPLKKFYKAQVSRTMKWKLFIDEIENKLPFYIQELVKTKGESIKEYKEWITKILEIKDLGNKKSQIIVEILTGRTHQIRYHLSEKWLPITWDDLYWLDDDDKLHLTAFKLEFLDVEWKNVCIEI